MEKTFVMLKPSTIVRGITGKVINKLEEKGIKIVAIKMLTLNKETAKKLYEVHERKKFFESLIAYITSAPVIAMVVECEDAVNTIRKLIGPTNPKDATQGTIRGDMAMNIQKNLIHASDSIENSNYEINLFFKPEEISSYNRADEIWMY